MLAGLVALCAACGADRSLVAGPDQRVTVAPGDSPSRGPVDAKVVLVEFPHKGTYTIGFLTSKVRGDLQAKFSEELWSVFVPTTPNPTSGFLLMLPKRDIIEMEMSVGEGMKMVISGGTVVPPVPTGSRSPVPPQLLHHVREAPFLSILEMRSSSLEVSGATSNETSSGSGSGTVLSMTFTPDS